MANIYGRQFNQTLQPIVVSIFARIAIGAAGAPTLTTGKAKGVKSIVRNSAGNYTITFGNSSATQQYVSLLSTLATFQNATAPAAPLMFVAADAVGSAGTITIQFTNLSQVATDPGNGEVIKLCVDLSNSTAP